MMHDEKLSLANAFERWGAVNCGLDEVVLKAFKERKVIFFLGAGVSRIEGVKGWDEFSNTLIKKAFPSLKEQEEILRGVSSSKEKITIAYEKFSTEGKKEEFYQEFGKALEPSSASERVGIYETLAQFSVNFLTTNADSLLESVLGKEFCHSDYDEKKLFNPTHLPRKQLFYLHGRYSDGLDKLVFTAPQYSKRYNDNNFCSFLRKIFQNNEYVIFFIGYGLNEYELIDYIITKTETRIKGGGAAIYILEPFFSTQDALYGARKQYFASLGIKLLPYCIDDGYQQLNSILKIMLDVFKSQAHVPHDDYVDIKYYLNSDYTPALESYVNDILRKNMSHGVFRVACSAIMQSSFFAKWSEHIINNQLWFPAYDAKEYLGWNSNAYDRIFLLAFLLKSDSTYDIVVSKAKELLLCVSEETFAALKDSHGALLYKYVDLICLLKDDAVDNQCFELVKKLFGLYGIYFAYQGLENGIRITEWTSQKISELVYCIYDGIHILDELAEDQSDCLNNIFDKNNQIKYETELSQAFFIGMYKFFVEWLGKEKLYSGVQNISNLDNLKKARHVGLSAFIEKLVFYFNGMTEDAQKKYIQQGLQSEDDLICKAWIYILRKSKIQNDISFILNKKVRCFSYSTCICELYLLIKESDVSQYIGLLKERINVADFGLDVLYFGREYVSRIRNSFLELISVPFEGECEDIIGIAEKTDYPHIVDDCFSHETDSSIKDIFYQIEQETGRFKLFNLVNILGEKLKELSDEDFAENMSHIEMLRDDALNDIILCFLRDVQKLSQWKLILIYECAIRTLLSDRNSDILYKNCFLILAKADLDVFYVSHKKDLNQCWEKWNNRLLGPRLEEEFNKSFVSDLINTAEYEKVSFFCNYWATRRRVDNISLSVDELMQIKSAAQDSTIKWCMAYRFSYISFVVEKPVQVEGLADCFVSNRGGVYDYIALYLLLSGAIVINNYVVQLLVKSKLLEKNDLLQAADDISSQRLYNYIAASFFSDKITLENILSVADKKDFYDAIIRCINMTDNDSNIDKFTGKLWPNISHYVLNNKTLIEQLIRPILFILQVSIERKSYKIGLAEIEKELLEKCNNGSVELFFSADQLINLYEQDTANGKKIIELILLKSRYLTSLRTEVEKLFRYFSIKDNTYAEELLVLLYENNQISLDYYKKLYDMIETNQSDI